MNTKTALLSLVQPTGGEAWYTDVAVPVDLEVRPSVEPQGGQFLSRERMPVSQGAAQVVLVVVVMTSTAKIQQSVIRT